ncbi:MAG TPA: divalent-cation tolerance protein CutA [Sphingobium sp.]|nr:divalent-cation tolerance protein CutA [Sphingobium sp.]
MSEIALVYVLYGTRPAAEVAARTMVAQRLAACANVFAQGQSFYQWAGALEAVTEVAVLFKTAPARCDALMAALERDHPYELPAILSWRVTARPAYAAWVERETASQP